MKTILEQLGGRHFLMAVGATNLVVASDVALVMTINNSKKLNRVRITKRGATYDIDTWYNTKLVYSQSDVCCEELQKVLTKATGLVSASYVGHTFN